MSTFFLFVAVCMSWSYTSAIFAEQQSPSASTKQTVFAPTIHHPNIKDVTLFAQNPQIVTPVGIAVAPDGRVFVQENHTHKRTKEYFVSTTMPHYASNYQIGTPDCGN